jgi:Triosephosphate isomerase
LTATPEQAQETHAAIRQYLGKIAGADVAAETRILYGGSASGKTAPGLSQKDDIDGTFHLSVYCMGYATIRLCLLTKVHLTLLATLQTQDSWSEEHP